MWGKSMMPTPHLACSGPRVNLQITFFFFPWTGTDRARVDVGRWGTEPSRCGKHGKAEGALGFMGHGRVPGHWLNDVNKGRGMRGEKGMAK